MRRVEIELMTVTPLFLGGSDPRNQPPELRPPSFRGAMRYWYRAALGGVVGDDWKKVRQLEGRVFGITSDEQRDEKEDKQKDAGRGSSVNVRIRSAGKPQLKPFVKENPPQGKSYLFWSLAEIGKPGSPRHQPAREYIPEGYSFSLSMTSFQVGTEAERSLRHATYALWLTIHLGGVGARSRRLAGSLSPSRVLRINDLTFGMERSDPNLVAQQLANNLTIIRQSLSKDFGAEANFSKFPLFDVLNPAYCRIWVLGIAPNWESALNFVGKKMQDFRCRREPDHKRVAKWINGLAIPTVERVQFGLPIVYRYSNGLSGTIIAKERQEGKDVKIERRASPLWLSAIRCQDGKIIVTATLFINQFLPPGSKLAIDKNDEVPLVNPPNETNLILDWLRQDFPKAVEVKYA